MAKTLYERCGMRTSYAPGRRHVPSIYRSPHLHEVTSPQAFQGLRLAGRSRGGWTRTSRHPITTYRRHRDRIAGIEDECRASRSKRSTKLRHFNIRQFEMTERQGIVHVIGPERARRNPE